eukprot:5533156-Karenia_brevis.AAC.1
MDGGSGATGNWDAGTEAGSYVAGADAGYEKGSEEGYDHGGEKGGGYPGRYPWPNNKRDKWGGYYVKGGYIDKDGQFFPAGHGRTRARSRSGNSYWYGG